MVEQVINTRSRKWLWLFFSFAVCGVYYGIIYKRYNLVLHRDDAMMRAIASGTYTGTPDGHLIFIKYCYGYLLSRLYLLNRAYNWYGICEYVICCSGMALILWKLLRKNDRSIGRKCWGAFIFLLSYTILVFPILVGVLNFTHYAALCGVTGIFFLVTAENGSMEYWGDLVISCIFTGLSLMIREDIFYIVLCLEGFFLLCKVYYKRKNLKNVLKQYLRWILVMICMVSVISGVEHMAYRSEAWKKYLDYNDNRSYMVDYYGWQGYERYKTIYEKYGITEQAAYLMDYYFLDMDDVDMNALLQDLVDYEDSISAEEGLINKFETALIQFYGYFTDKDYIEMNIFLIVAVVILLCKTFYCSGKNEIELLTLGTALLYIVMWLYLIFRGRIVSRACVSMQLLFVAFLFGIYYSGDTDNVGSSSYIVRKIYLRKMAICIVLMYLAGHHILNIGWGTDKKDVTEVTKYAEKHSDNIYIVTDGGCAVETNDTIKVIDGASNVIYPGGWVTNSPLYEEKTKKYNVESILNALISCENVYYIDCETDLKDRIQGYYNGEGIEIMYNVEDSIQMEDGKTFYVYRFERDKRIEND